MFYRVNRNSKIQENSSTQQCKIINHLASQCAVITLNVFSWKVIFWMLIHVWLNIYHCVKQIFKQEMSNVFTSNDLPWIKQILTSHAMNFIKRNLHEDLIDVERILLKLNGLFYHWLEIVIFNRLSRTEHSIKKMNEHPQKKNNNNKMAVVIKGESIYKNNSILEALKVM